jgi:hypothetical protein
MTTFVSSCLVKLRRLIEFADNQIGNEQRKASRRLEFQSVRVVLHFAASSGRLHVTTPGVADDISFEAPLSTKAFIVSRQGPSPS